jgi:hypothetical protein
VTALVEEIDEPHQPMIRRTERDGRAAPDRWNAGSARSAKSDSMWKKVKGQV